jgi:hypothetical protein
MHDNRPGEWYQESLLFKITLDLVDEDIKSVAKCCVITKLRDSVFYPEDTSHLKQSTGFLKNRMEHLQRSVTHEQQLILI